jgi:hypothetical protein
VTDSCIGGICMAPACAAQSHTCTPGQCCGDLVCEGTDNTGNTVTCAAGVTGCSCQARCVGTGVGVPCSASAPCCTGLTCDTNGSCQLLRPG